MLKQPHQFALCLSVLSKQANVLEQGSILRLIRSPMRLTLGIFAANLAENQSVKKGRFCGYFPGKLRQRSIGFCADQTSIFNVFLTESSFALSTTIRSRTEPMAKPLTSWLVPSFSQHNQRLVVSELRDVVCTFQWRSFKINLQVYGK